MKAKYICFEGTEGVGKTTQTNKLVEYLRSKGYLVLQTKEPGTPLSPLTMILRGIMLDNQFDKELTKVGREFISQAIRSIHLERVIVPALSEYDYIIQDRGILSGYAYGAGCGNNIGTLKELSTLVIDSADENCTFRLPLKTEQIYDSVIYLRGNVEKGLQTALSSKKEFETGDAMESRGNTFLQKVSSNMDEMSNNFNTVRIDVDNKSIDEVHSAILRALNI